MRFVMVFLAVTIVVTGWSEPVEAQNQRWIQVASERTIRDTHDRAQDFAAQFPDTRAFLTTSGWYAIVIGPIDEVDVHDLMANLKAANQIPQDSLVSTGSSHVSQLWPLAVNTETPPEEAVAAEEPTPPAEEPVVEEPEVTEPVTTAVVEPEEETVVETTDPPLEEQVEQPKEEVVEVQPEEPAGPIPDPDLKATRALERSWTRDQKKEYQTYMAWTGDYTAAIDGDYGRGTRKAIRSFQEREGYEDTGYLTETQVVLLTKRYNDSVTKLGIGTLRELDAGIEILFPGKMVEFGSFEPPFVHYKSIDDSNVRMMLISQEGGRDTLRSLYDIMETFDYIPKEGYRVRKRDWFVLTGQDDNVVSYTYAKTAKGVVKGFTLIWTPDNDSEMQSMATAMYNSFKPIDNYVLDETLGYGQGDDEPVDLTTGIDTAEPERSATGFIISADGLVLTHIANVRKCKRVTIADGVPLELVARSPGMRLVVMRPREAYTPKSFALFSDEAPEIGTEITVAGFSFPEVMEVATLNFGTLTSTSGMLGNEDQLRVSAFLEMGDTGGPVLDNRGAVIGMQLMKSDASESLPEYVNFAIKSGRIMELLDRNELTYGRSRSFDPVDPEDLAYMAGDFTVKVSCWN